MQYSTKNFIGVHGVKNWYHQWLPDDGARAVVQISHGMGESAVRYGRFAEFLCNRKIGVYGNDHVGHGKTAGSIDRLGQCGPDSFTTMMENMKILNDIIRKENKDIPVILLGHSMGSFEALLFIQKYSALVNGCILSGTSYRQNPVMLMLGSKIAQGEIRKNGDETISRRLTDMIFTGNNRAFHPAKTPFDWLSGDSEEVKKYVDDPYCGHAFTSTFFHCFFNGTNH